MYQKFFKRFFDFIFALLGLIILSLVFLVVAILIAIFLGIPVLFKQKRPGLHGKIFTVYKFRTMNDKKDSTGELLPDKDRLTSFGKILRKTSLDEIPQLWNVLKGDMSFIGPRPLLVEYLDLYTKEQAKRHDVRPGITGWAQVNGRNAISWEEKFVLDVYYASHVTLKLDLKIFFLTVKKVLKSEDINQSTDQTMEKFTG